MHLEKNRTYACTFPVQSKEINVVKVRFTMRYSSRKLSNGKVIATACNFWRQIACSFKVMSRNILILGKKIFEIPPFSQTRPGDLGKKVHACSLCFSALKVPMRSLLSAKNRERVGERTAFSASIPVTSQLMVESRNDRTENAWGLGYSGLFTQPRWAIPFMTYIERFSFFRKYEIPVLFNSISRYLSSLIKSLSLVSRL